jgi:hypothetical protein
MTRIDAIGTESVSDDVQALTKTRNAHVVGVRDRRYHIALARLDVVAG